MAQAFDPATVAENVLNHSHWETSQRIIRSVMRPHAKVAVKGCHASGKTFSAADVILLSLILGGDVMTTAPTDDQVRGQLWEHVHNAIRTSRIPLSEWGDVNQISIRLPTGEWAMGRSTNQGVRFHGYHARPGSFLLVIADEAPGVLAEIFEAISGIQAGGDVRLLFLGNPIIASGPFYDIFAGDMPGWERFTIDAFDTPNLHGLTLETLLDLPDHELDNNVRPYLVTRRWVAERYHEWGEQHALWQSRVRGRFPLQAADALLNLSWLEMAKLREATYDPDGEPLIAGIDVAGPGDAETVVAVRQGPHLLALRAYTEADAVPSVVAMLNPWRHKGLASIRFDSAGIGYYFGTSLRDAFGEDSTVRLEPINVGQAPTSDEAAEQFANLKAELYWAFRERCRDGDINGLTDQTAISQLAGIRYDHTNRGKVMIESKEEARKRGVKSPDRAEALVLAYAPVDRRALYGQAIGVQGSLYAPAKKLPEPAPVHRPAMGRRRW